VAVIGISREFDDGMNVIRHENETFRTHGVVVPHGFLPGLGDHAAERRRRDVPVPDAPKGVAPFMSAQGDQVVAGHVVVRLVPHGTSS
jgi:hypothetical protein